MISSLVALLLAGEPELSRIVAWDLESKSVLIAEWHGISHEDPPPKELATNFRLYVDGKLASDVSCFDQKLTRDEDEVPIRSCAREELASALRLGNQGTPGELAEFRVQRKEKRLGEAPATVQRKTPKGWVTVTTVTTFAVPKLTGVVHGEKVTLLVLGLTIPKSAFGIPSSHEEAVFIPR